jgi:exodeoxyribonuclease-3
MAELKIISYNVNGVRAAIKKGLLEWLPTINADIVCLQELKADNDAFDKAAFQNLGYESYTFPAEKNGRNIRIEIGDLSVMSVYIPSGTTGDERQGVKMKYLDDFYAYIANLQKERPKLLICGDYNICHTEIDIHNPISNKDTSGFKPEERSWMSKYFDSGFIDSFRHFNKDPHHYSWWSLRANSRANNKGWRIDYISATKNLEKNLIESRMYPDAMHSDHCPVYLKLKR